MSDIDADILKTFLDQAGEVLADMEQGLLILEAHPADEESLNQVFRGAHMLKGDASMLGLTELAELAHVIEDLLEKLRSRRITVNSRLVTVLLRSVDALRMMLPAGAGAEAPAEALVAAGVERGASAVSSASLRVDAAKLDKLLNLTGEISIWRERLAQMLEEGRWPAARLLEAHRESDQLHRDLQDLVMKSRMIPVGPMFRQFRLMVRDLAQTLGKQAVMELGGEDVEMDARMVDQLRDPLTHMIRNALDHGLEAPEARRAAGKDPCGRIALNAFHEAGSVFVELVDDGAGLDRARILLKARENGLIRGEDPATDRETFSLIFEPGFSTAEKVTETSGRGVGMDIVRKNIEALRGHVEVRSEAGRGTTISLRLPLTLAIIQGLAVSAADETYVLPMDSVAECLELPRGVASGAARPVLSLRGAPLTCLRLCGLHGLGAPRGERENVVVLRQGGESLGLVVDTLLGASQTVIKPLPARFQGLDGIAGSTILGNGRVALILDVAGLFRSLREARQDMNQGERK